MPESGFPFHAVHSPTRSGRTNAAASVKADHCLMGYDGDVDEFRRITMDPETMGGKPCIRGMRVTAGMIVEALAAGWTME
jgi:hypothetical protein